MDLCKTCAFYLEEEHLLQTTPDGKMRQFDLPAMCCYRPGCYNPKEEKCPFWVEEDLEGDEYAER